LAAISLPQDADFILCRVSLAFHFSVPFRPRLTHPSERKS
jgi:hypothetical protein